MVGWVDQGDALLDPLVAALGKDLSRKQPLAKALFWPTTGPTTGSFAAAWS
jgi:hypothetical protein